MLNCKLHSSTKAKKVYKTSSRLQLAPMEPERSGGESGTVERESGNVGLQMLRCARNDALIKHTLFYVLENKFVFFVYGEFDDIVFVDGAREDLL